MINPAKYDPSFIGDLIVTGYFKKRKNHGIWTTISSKYVKRFVTLNLNNYTLDYKEKEEEKIARKIYFLNDLFCVFAYDQNDNYLHPKGYNYSLLFDFHGTRFQIYTKSYEKFNQMCKTLGCCFTFKKEPFSKFQYQDCYDKKLSSKKPVDLAKQNLTKIIEEKPSTISISLTNNKIRKNLEDTKLNEENKPFNIFISNKNRNQSSRNDITKSKIQNSRLVVFVERKSSNQNNQNNFNQEKINKIDNIPHNSRKEEKQIYNKNDDSEQKNEKTEFKANIDNILKDKIINDNLQELTDNTKLYINQENFNFKKNVMLDNYFQFKPESINLSLNCFKDKTELKNLPNFNFSKNKSINDSQHLHVLKQSNEVRNKPFLDIGRTEPKKELNISFDNISKKNELFIRRARIKQQNPNWLNITHINNRNQGLQDYSNKFCPYKPLIDTLSVNFKNSIREKPSDRGNLESNNQNLNSVKFIIENVKRTWNIEDKEVCTNQTSLVDLIQYKEKINTYINKREENRCNEEINK